MSSYIHDNRDALGERHYIRKASAESYWFDFTQGKLQRYREKFADDFCLVLYGSEAEDDAYVLPAATAMNIFQAGDVDHRGRWMGTIRNNLMYVSTGKRTMVVSPYYNAFELLEIETDADEEQTDADFVQMGDEEQLQLNSLRGLIAAFNQQYRDAIPRKRLILSFRIARPGAIAEYLKTLHDFTCQICGVRGFEQRNGVPYAEAYHIIELHRLIPGSYCSDNMVVVCPTCQRKLRFARVCYESLPDERIRVTMNGEERFIDRNVISNQISRSDD